MEAGGPRQHRSRRNRPCDLCRSRKIACKISTTPPCEFCASKGRPCTFETPPGLRKRRKQSDAPRKDSGNEIRNRRRLSSPRAEATVRFAEDTNSNSFVVDDRVEVQSSLPVHERTDVETVDINDQLAEQSRLPRLVSVSSEQESHTSSPPITHNSDTLSSCGSRFDPFQNVVQKYIGPSGDLDPVLVAHRKYDDDNESTSYYTKTIYRRMWPLRSDIDALIPPVFVSMPCDERDETGDTGIDPASAGMRDAFNRLVDGVTASGLVALYLRFVHPFMLILSRQQVPSQEEAILDTPLPLLAALCATAVPFAIYDDVLCIEASRLPKADDLFQISWQALLQEKTRPSLATVQTYLLHLQRHHESNAQSYDISTWTLCSEMISIAQALGLHDDPSSWTTLPKWERRLRRRLWWACWVTDKWISFGHGMPSHLHQGGSSVTKLELDDLEDDENHSPGASLYFLSLTQLTCILSDTVDTFFTIRSYQQYSQNIDDTLRTARDLKQRLGNWNQNLPKELRPSRSTQIWGASTRSVEKLNGIASLQIAFFATELAVFQALIRLISMHVLRSTRSGSSAAGPLSSSISHQLISATMQGVVAVLDEFVQLVSCFNTLEWDAFWPGWSRHNFALASTILMHCYLLTSPKSISKRAGENSSTMAQGHSPLSESLFDLSSLHNEDANTVLDISSLHAQVRELALRWRWVLQLATRGAAGRKGLVGVSLLRINALFTEWEQARIQMSRLCY